MSCIVFSGYSGRLQRDYGLMNPMILFPTERGNVAMLMHYIRTVGNLIVMPSLNAWLCPDISDSEVFSLDWNRHGGGIIYKYKVDVLPIVCDNLELPTISIHNTTYKNMYLNYNRSL